MQIGEEGTDMDTEKITSNMSHGALAVFTALLIGWKKYVSEEQEN